MCVVDGDDVVCILSVEPSHGVRVTHREGRRHPLRVGASGIAASAAMPRGEGERAAVSAARRVGYAVSHSEITAGTVAAAAPLHLPSHDWIGAVSLLFVDSLRRPPSREPGRSRQPGSSRKPCRAERVLPPRPRRPSSALTGRYRQTRNAGRPARAGHPKARDPDPEKLIGVPRSPWVLGSSAVPRRGCLDVSRSPHARPRGRVLSAPRSGGGDSGPRAIREDRSALAGPGGRAYPPPQWDAVRAGRARSDPSACREMRTCAVGSHTPVNRSSRRR